MGADTVTGDGGSAIRIADPSNAITNTDDLTGITMSNIGSLNLGSSVAATMNQDNIDSIATFANKGAVTGALSFAGKNVYGDGQINSVAAASWKASATLDLAQFVTGMQTFIGTSPYANGTLNQSLTNMNPAINAIDASGLNESNMDLLVGDLNKAQILSGGDGVEFIYGGDFAETITTGGGVLNFVASRGGDDNITGGAGTDFIAAGKGDDTVSSGDAQDFVTTDDMDVANGNIIPLSNSDAGNDVIDLGAGDDFVAVGSNLQTADEINGGDGTDYVVFEGDYATSALSLGATTLTNVEYFIMSNGYDYNITLHDNTFTSATATIQGGGLASGDILTIDASAESPATNITISSGDANDSLTGGAGADTIIGGAGNDTITGGAGADTLIGGRNSSGNFGDGDNIFKYQALGDSSYAGGSSAWDTISGFDASDKIDLSELTITAKQVGGILDKGDLLNFASLTNSNFFNGTVGVSEAIDWSVAVGSDGTNAMIFVDLDGDGNLGNDLAFIVGGHANADAIMQTSDYILV
jgi:Ca2+-binding RTX toxin-like protein